MCRPPASLVQSFDHGFALPDTSASRTGKNGERKECILRRVPLPACSSFALSLPSASHPGEHTHTRSIEILICSPDEMTERNKQEKGSGEGRESMYSGVQRYTHGSHRL